MSYKECKDAKRLFRRIHRQIVDPYLLKVQNDIDKLVNKCRKKSISEPGLEINFGGTNIRERQLIANEWGYYFQELFTPAQSADYDVDLLLKMRCVMSCDLLLIIALVMIATLEHRQSKLKKHYMNVRRVKHLGKIPFL